MMQIQIKREKFLCGAVFLFFILITAYKLTNSSLWYDEAIEYWYSKVMIGELPFADTATNMYQRIIITFQPPLYNVIMHFWLMVSDSEWWFRFFGVVIGFVGMIGLYKTIRKIGNIYIAALAVVFSTCVYQLVYYWQEASEYCLMLGTLFWAVYFWFCLIENPNRKNIIRFTISAVIPVYSQYGAVFPVVVMAVVALIYVVALKDRKKILTILVSYIAAFLLAALPLYLFFFKKQLLNQQGGEIELTNISFTGGIGGILRNFFGNLCVVFKWNFLTYYSDAATFIIFVLILLMVIITIVLSRNTRLKLFIVTNIITWLLYYICVKVGVYAYGSFGNRYNLFFIPIWVILLFAVAVEFVSIISRYLPEKFEIKTLCAGVGLCFVLCFACFVWVSKLQANWSKEDNRGVVDEWYEVGAEDSNTIVYYGACAGFTYYVRQSSQYNESTENNVNYMPLYSYRDVSEDEYREYVDSIYGGSWPDEIYVVASHFIRNEVDLNNFIASITSMGYEREDIYSSSDACLVRLFKS